MTLIVYIFFTTVDTVLLKLIIFKTRDIKFNEH